MPSAKRRAAFTLIELLIVITVIGVLAAVIMIAINPAKRNKQARDATRKSDIAQMSTALRAYFTTKSTYPVGLIDLTSSEDLKIIPRDPDPAGVAQYQYAVSGSGLNSESAVWVTLEDPTSGSGSWVWCWRSSSGQVTESLVTDCTAP